MLLIVSELSKYRDCNSLIFVFLGPGTEGTLHECLLRKLIQVSNVGLLKSLHPNMERLFISHYSNSYIMFQADK